MLFKNRGPVTRNNSIFHDNGTVSCPISTNSWSSDQFFTIDASKFSLVEGLYWHTKPQRANGDTVLRMRAWINKEECPVSGQKGSNPNKTGAYLHQLLFHVECPSDQVVDHIFHWTDNRRASVQFVTREENTRLGAALFHHGKRNSRNKKRVA